jgi:hypothetical protein
MRRRNLRQLIDMRCAACGRTAERYIAEDSVPCACGGTMNKIIGMPRIALDGTDPGFPGAYDRWASIREANAREKNSRKASRGE